MQSARACSWLLLGSLTVAGCGSTSSTSTNTTSTSGTSTSGTSPTAGTSSGAGTGSAGSSPASGSTGGSGLSVQQRLQTAQLCLGVAGSVRMAAQVGLKLANGSLTQADATGRLGPIATHLTDLATKNASLPVGASLKALSVSIAKVQATSPTNLAEVKAAGTQLTTATKALLLSCANARH